MLVSEPPAILLARAARFRCAVCGAECGPLLQEVAEARSNVRAFRSRTFALWRCRVCASIHARDDVDLDHYYRRYPFHALPEDRRVEILYAHQLSRLRRAGVGPRDRILDYGCGAGAFVAFLRRRGYRGAVGYDRYSAEFADPSLLEQRYDFVVTQDVLEHVAEPRALLDEFHRLVRPCGVIAIGTPNAEAIDLRVPEKYVHTLHAPYHRHIFSSRALVAAGTARGWSLERYYRTPYGNTAVPFLNSRFYLYYMRTGDDTLDWLIEPPRLATLLKRLPLTLFWGLFGSLFAEETDVMAVFRRGPRAGPPRHDMSNQS